MMIDFFDKLYTKANHKSYGLLGKIARFLIRFFANVIMRILYCFCKKRHFLPPCQKICDRIIVSVTSFPARINNVDMVFESLLRQSVKPDMMILWLSKLQFESIDRLPKRLLNLQKRGVEIRMVDEDIRSHKKYYYTLQKFPLDTMVIVDDDIMYRSTMIEDFLNHNKRYPGSIIVQYGRNIERNSQGELCSYKKWRQIRTNIPINYMDIFFGSGGGTFVPAGALYKDILDYGLFLSLSPIADDVWLNAMARLQGTKIVKTKYYSANVPVINKSNITLASVNNNKNKNMNDVQIDAVRKHYIETINIDPFA